MLSQEQTQTVASMPCERAWVEVNLRAIDHNIRQIRGLLSPGTQLMGVVKADAYGHCARTVAQTILKVGAGWLGVATIPEGIELRKAGIEAPILILGATNTPEQIQALAAWQLQPTLCNPKQALVFSETLVSFQQSLPVHIKLDTGMSRLGMSWQEAPAFVQWVQSLPNLDLVSIYSHLATADSPDPTIMAQQHQRFAQAIAACGFHPCRHPSFPAPGEKPSTPFFHLANSAGTLADPQLHYNLVRVGLAMYGIAPAPHLQNIVNLKSALQVRARVTQVKTIPAGAGVSYGHKFVAPREMQIAIVGIGYADGVPRNLSNQMKVLLRNQPVSQIGAITMDQLMLDVSAFPDLEVGEVVTLLGKQGNYQIHADDWANQLGTISWEILCGFKHRLPRVFLD